MRATRLRALAAVMAAAVALAGAGCGSSGDDDGATTGASTAAATAKKVPVTVLLDWFPNPDHVSIYTAQAEGYYDEAGLDVELQPPADPTDAPKLVASGKADLGINYQGELTSIAATQALPLVSVGALIPATLNSLIAPARTGMETVADLKGKKVGSSNIPVTRAILNYMLEDAGLSPSDIEFVNIGQNYDAPLISGAVDAVIGGYPNINGVILREKGLDPSIISSGTVVPQTNELNIIANRDKLSDPAYQDLVRRFLAATAKGAAKATADPQAGYDALAPVSKGYDKDLLRKMVDATLPYLENDGGFGYQDAAKWNAYARWALDQRLIDEPVDGASLMTNDYLPSE